MCQSYSFYVKNRLLLQDRMANSYFQFKQFLILQDRCAMKVGTDGVLLGAWTEAAGAARILDIGTGTGLIALMLAQKNSHAQIDAIDIDANACEQAAGNALGSPFAGRIRVHSLSLSEYAETNNKRYDLIVSNPPYFVRSLKSPEEKRSLARHNDSLSLSDLIRLGRSMLTEEGKISLILPPALYEELLLLLPAHVLSIRRLTEVAPVPGAVPKRYLVELSPKQADDPVETNRLVIEEKRHQYTPEYIRLTKDFYLNM